MPPRRPRLTEQDRRDWAEFARHIKAMPGRERELAEVPAAPVAEVPIMMRTVESVARLASPLPAALPRALAVGTQPGGLDNSTWGRFRAGKLAPTRTLDLHGRTAQHAFFALRGFLQAAHADHVRCVEIITGRGSGEAGGVLRRELPLWLNLPDLRPLVLAAAHPHAANPGAVRLLLRRPR